MIFEALCCNRCAVIPKPIPAVPPVTMYTCAFVSTKALKTLKMHHMFSITLPLRSGMSLLGSNLFPVIKCAILKYEIATRLVCEWKWGQYGHQSNSILTS